MKVAKYARVSEGEGQCELCPRRCRMGEGGVGFCGTRGMREGVMVALGYGAVTSCALDPIEKKPLYHFYPGHTVLSIGTYGCNLACEFCQNWRISQGDPEYRVVSVDQIMGAAMQSGGDCIGIAYTYSEPAVWYEFVYDCAVAAKEQGLANVLVTNGTICPEPFAELSEHLDAVNIDLKGFTEEFYAENCKGSLEPVLDTIESAARVCHLEVTTLVIPGLNDSVYEAHQASGWLSQISPDIPMHISRYFPSYRMGIPPTPIETLKAYRDAARNHLNYVYIGNADIAGASDTLCPLCGETIIERRGARPVKVALRSGACSNCGRNIPIVGSVPSL